MRKLLGLTAALSLAAGAALAQTPPPGGPGAPGGAGRPGGMMNMPIAVTDLGNGMVFLRGGSNTLLAEGKTGAIVVDTQFGTGTALVKKIHDTTSLPVKYVINSNADPDHTAANALLHKEGATIVATKNAAVTMGKDRANPRGGIDKAIPVGGRATILVTAKKTISIPGQTAVITPVRPAHTDGDEFIYFPKSNVLYIGDLLHSAEWPVYDGESSACKCGTFTGQISALETVLATINGKTIVVPGHGPLTDAAHVQALLDTLTWLKAVIRNDIAAGMTREQVIASKPLASKTATLQQSGRDNSDQFVGSAYDSIKAGH